MMMLADRRAQGDGSVYQGRDGGWHASLRLGRDSTGKPIRRHVRAATRRQAVSKLELLRISYGPVRTVGDWTATWMALVERTLKWSTAKSYRTHVGYLVPLAELPLTELTTEHVESIYTALADRGVSGETIQSVHRSVRSCFGEAVKRGLMARNPVLVARPHRPERVRAIQPLSLAEVRAVLAAAVGTRNAARWQVALALGLRQGEALGLQWADIDFEQATLTVRRALQRRTWKHGCQAEPCGRQAWRCPERHSGGLVVDSPKSATSIRTIALPPVLVAALGEHQRAQAAERAAAGNRWQPPPAKDGLNSGTGWVFATAVGKPIRAKDDWSAWKDLLADAGVRDARVHDARHTAATLMLVAGIHSRTVIGVLGWSHPLMLMRYQHVVDDLQRDAVQRIEQLIWSPTP
jgi:integrase